MKDYRRYIVSFFILLLFEGLGISLFNWFIDPAGVTTSSTIEGVNNVKTAKEKQVRLFKTVAIAQIQPRAIVVGSSRTEFGIDPSHEIFNRSRPAYNLAITGANMYEAKRYFDHALALNPELKKAVIGIDFFMFNTLKKNAQDFREERLEKDYIIPTDWVNILFSINNFQESINTIKTSSKNPNEVGYFYSDGRRNADFYIKQIYQSASGKDLFRTVLRRNDFLSPNDSEKVYDLSDDFLQAFSELIESCKINKIDCTVFISPSHVTQWESIRVGGMWATFEEWKREVVKITPVWDFSGYNSITSEPISRKMKNYFDSSHYRKEVGDLVLNRMFEVNIKEVPQDFGVWVTEDNIDRHLMEMRSQREQWAKDNREWVKMVEDLKE
jgi:hypothetical protein